MFPVSQPSLTSLERQMLIDAFESGQITHGPMVEHFEKLFAAHIGTRFALATSSGTTALHLITNAIVSDDDEVLVPNLSFIASVNAVAYTGATPVLCDIDARTWSISLNDAKRKLSTRTRAIMVVHLYGQPAPMGDVLQFAQDHDLMVIEDVAEGLGGVYRGIPLGRFSHAAAFSFFGNKVITTGEGGMVVTDNEALYESMKTARGQGQHKDLRYFHPSLGFNYRLTDLQAALGVAQMRRLDSLLAARRRVFSTYRRELTGSGIEMLTEDAAPWLFTVLLPEFCNRDRVAKHLRGRDIDTRPTFVPMSEMPMYGRPLEQFPVSALVSNRGLSLPTYPELLDGDIRYIALQLRDVVRLENTRGVVRVEVV